MSAPLRIAGVVKQSIVDGPGLRFVVFTQGCPHRCPGCHNPQSHDFAGGSEVAVEALLGEMDRNPLLKGVTLSGGEPFAQAGALLPLARAVKERGMDLYCYSGYTLEQLLIQAQEDEHVAALLQLVDVLIDGPYLEEQRDLTLRFRGSANQRLLDLPASLARGEAVCKRLEE